MRLDKVVCVELGEDGSAIRIFKSENTAHASGVCFTKMYYRVAVSQIRHKVWLRCKGECERCGSIINEYSMEMHEKKHRGRQGEISLENSIGICKGSHKYQHRDRNPRFKDAKVS